MELREKLIAIRAKDPKSWVKIAKDIGICTPVLNKWRKHKPVHEIVELKIKNYIERNQ